MLDQTAFYAESGGQPWDTGRLDQARVIAVLETQGRILHVLDVPLEQDRVRGVVDEGRRRDHRQQHHGQHLLSRALLDTASARTLSFHLGAETSSMDLDREVPADGLAAAECLANRVVREARPVSVRNVSRSEAAALGAPAPEQAGDSVRLVSAEGFDLQPCGGTHPRSTAEAGPILLLGAERHKAGTRVRFVCGDRALDAARLRTRTLERLGVLLSAPLEGLEPAVERLLEQVAAGRAEAEDLKGRLLDAEAAALLEAASGEPPVVARIYEGRAPQELRALALAVTGRGRCLALLGGRTDKAHLVFAQTPGLGCDVPGLLAGAVARLGGRGGGRGDVAQGGGDRTECLDNALAAARASAAGPR